MEPYSITVKNSAGQELKLTQSPNYIVSYFGGGFFPTAATTSFTAHSIYDGETLSYAKVRKANINLTVVVRGNVEANRINLYKYLRPTEKVTIYYKNGLRDVYIEGVVEDLTPDPFTLVQTVNVVIVAPNPFWNARNETETSFSSVINGLYFPYPQANAPTYMSYLNYITERNVYNSGEIETGFEMTMNIRGELTKPRFINSVTGKYFEINYNFIEGDDLQIGTVDGEEYVKLIRNATAYNLFNYITNGSTWLKLSMGDNVFAYSAETGATNGDFKILHRDLFAGV